MVITNQLIGQTMVAQNKSVTGIFPRTDYITIREIMAYFKTEDHDIFVQYSKMLEIQRND